MPPLLYDYGITKIIFPKDGEANGTWIVLKNNGDALCLLNGAFQKYDANKNYTTSRGKMLVTLSLNDDTVAAFEDTNLLAVAPFTLVIVYNSNLFECRWDGEKKYHKKLDSSVPHIWSSATLYSLEQRKMRLGWFNTWVQKIQNISPEVITAFHTNAGNEYNEASLVIKDNTVYSTVSITNVVVSENEYSMFYKDLKNHDSFTKITIKEEELFK